MHAPPKGEADNWISSRAAEHRPDMDQFFGSAYRGDPGVPHSGHQPFKTIGIGCACFAIFTWNNPYIWQMTNQYKYSQIPSLLRLLWHDKAMLFEQYHWKKARAKNQPYKFKWNEKSKTERDAYYVNWPIYFP
ncbi:hypothetical protein STAS_22417 [Striga asiatica]|uniref:Uncharacterized protein n=1 Tax=Striga asiatica TaxID=4170 RepID=A0A5A7QK77_STRAF|nr:hypothetical protein STAS_22417 [Striga asiatica]